MGKGKYREKEEQMQRHGGLIGVVSGCEQEGWHKLRVWKKQEPDRRGLESHVMDMDVIR